MEIAVIDDAELPRRNALHPSVGVDEVVTVAEVVERADEIVGCMTNFESYVARKF